MKPITEQWKQHLIAHCKVVMSVKSKGSPEYFIAEIALASLTAEKKTIRPFGFPQMLGEGCWVECEGSEEDATNFYTTPPVPVIKLPDDIDWNSAFKLLDVIACGDDRIRAFMMGANWRLSEVKRLNGLGD